MKCIYCDHPYTYVLGNGQRKCSKCRRRFSPGKLERRTRIWTLFLSGLSAAAAAKESGMHYLTIQKYYTEFRIELARECDADYRRNAHRVREYDEYLYLPKSLRAEQHIDKLRRFLTLSYDTRVYNLLLPEPARLVSVSLEEVAESEQKLLLKYLRYHKVTRLSRHHSTVTEFWKYFESFIASYKGISASRFPWYLKEAEWRFNHRYDP